jgi:hypothetical protein
VGEAEEELAVVGKEEEALGLPVQPPHRLEAGDLGEKLKDRPSGVGV